MTKFKPRRRLFAGLTAIAAALALSVLPAVPAQAVTPCYESGTLVSSKSLADGVVTYTASVQWRKLYNCSNIQIGVRIIQQAWSFSGGTIASGHGIRSGGADFKKASYSYGDPITPLHSYGGVRSITINDNIYVYSRTVAGTSYSFADATTYIYLLAPHSTNPGAADRNVWYNFQTNSIYWACQAC